MDFIKHLQKSLLKRLPRKQLKKRLQRKLKRNPSSFRIRENPYRKPLDKRGFLFYDTFIVKTAKKEIAKMSVMPLNQLKETLKTNIVEVTFTKKDGSERVMKATQDLDNLIPREKHPKGVGKECKNPNIVSVFDTEKGEWRSFDFSRVSETKVFDTEKGIWRSSLLS